MTVDTPTYRVKLASSGAEQTIEQLKYNRWVEFGGPEKIESVLKHKNGSSVFQLGRAVYTVDDVLPCDDLSNLSIAYTAISPELDDEDYEYGDASTKMGKESSDSSSSAVYEWAISPTWDWSEWGWWRHLRLYISEAALNVLDYIVFRIWYSENFMGDNGKVTIWPADLSVGWNSLWYDITGDDWYSWFSNENPVDRAKVQITTSETTDSIALGDLKWDVFRAATLDYKNEETGQEFTVSEDSQIDWVKVIAKPVDGPPDNLVCELGQLSGDPLSWTNISTSGEEYPTPSGDVEFSFPGVLLSAGSTYAFKVYRTGECASNHWFEVTFSSSGSYGGGEKFTKVDGSYAKQSLEDLYFVIGASMGTLENIGERIETGESELLLESVHYWLDNVGTPADGVKCAIYDDSGTLINEAPEEISATGEAVFTLPCTLEPETSYWIMLYRTGSIDENNYWLAAIHEGAVYANGTLGTVGTGMDGETEYVSNSDADMKFILTYEWRFPEVDITDDVREITVDRGVSALSGKIQQGSCDVTVRDEGGKYKIGNSKSPLHPNFDYMQEIVITAEYAGETYEVFSGIILDCKPKPGIPAPQAIIQLRDRLYKFQETEVSIGAQSGKTASGLVAALLEAAGLDAAYYDVQSDDQALADVTWDNVKLLDKLNTVVECGQHYHFMNGAGTYIFRTNQWLLHKSEEMTFDPENVESYDINNSAEDIINKVEVVYPTGTAEANDYNSQAKYGLRELTINNELMPDDETYAQAIADYILEQKSRINNELQFTLASHFPEMLQLDFGSRIAFVSEDYDIDDVYVVKKLRHRISMDGSHTLQVKADWWREPPIVAALTEYEPVSGVEWLKLSEDVTHFSQGFQLTSPARPRELTVFLQYELENAEQLVAKIYETDTDGLPTGSPLAYALPVIIESGAGQLMARFSFNYKDSPVLESATTYAVVVDSPQTVYIDPGAFEGTEWRLLVTGAYVAPASGGIGYSFAPALYTHDTLGIGAWRTFYAYASQYLITAKIGVRTYLPSAVVLQAFLYSVTDGKPDTQLAASDTIQVTGGGLQNGNYVDHILNFYFSNPPQLDADTWYAIYFNVPQVTISGDSAYDRSNAPYHSWLKLVDEVPDYNLLYVDRPFTWNYRDRRPPFHPVNPAIAQIDLDIGFCSESTYVEILDSDRSTTVATSGDSTTGEFAFTTPPQLTRGNKYYLRIHVPTACRVQDGFKLRGSGYSADYSLLKGGSTEEKATRAMPNLLFHVEDYEAQLIQMRSGLFYEYSNQRSGVRVEGGADYLWRENMALSIRRADSPNVMIKNKWKVYGNSSGSYSDGIPAEKDAAGWSSLDPWDFWFNLKVIDE